MTEAADARPGAPHEPFPAPQHPPPHQVLRRSVESAQYTAIRYAERLGEIGAVRSVGSKGDSYDNAAAESLNSLYKRELIDLYGNWQGLSDVTMATMDWVAWYNNERIHSYAGGMSPKQFEEWFHSGGEAAKLTAAGHAN